MNQNLYDILLTIHSAGRWIVLLLLLLAIFNHMAAGSRTYSSGDRKLSLFLMIAADLMLLIGIVQWFTGSFGYKTIQARGMADVMKEPVLRFFTIEHMVGMILAIALIHIGKAQAKKNMPNRSIHRRTLIFYLLALIIILASIPWPFREVGAGRGWY